jgi:hypothetical protein
MEKKEQKVEDLRGGKDLKKKKKKKKIYIYIYIYIFGIKFKTGEHDEKR